MINIPIRLRRGLEADVINAQVQDGEILYCKDTGNIWIGQPEGLPRKLIPRKTVIHVNSDYQVNVEDDVLLLDTLAGTVSIQLPRFDKGKEIVLKKKAGVNHVNVMPTNGLIDGDSALTLALTKTSITLISDGADWYVI